VWDEAFLPLSAATWTRGWPGWALGSLTKAFACPGLRLGYAIAPDAGAPAVLRRRRPTWAVSTHGLAPLPSDAPWVSGRLRHARANGSEAVRPRRP
jgi:histidinol-phosphate/aromatic aminotransferase/cobyric acid decarboxylase-like protein